MEDLGFFAELISVIFMFILITNVKKDKVEYDERQILERGKASEYGFITMMVYFIFYAWLIQFISIDYNYVFIMSGVELGFMVYVIYAIIKDAYTGIKKFSNLTIVLFLVVGIFELVAGIFDVVYNGSFSMIWDIESGLMFIIIPLLILFKNKQSKEI